MIAARKKVSLRPSQRPTQPPTVLPRAPSYGPNSPSARANAEMNDLHLDAIGALRAILGFSTLIQEDTSQMAARRAQHYAAHIRSAGSALQGIVDRMAAVSREALDEERVAEQGRLESSSRLKLVGQALPSLPSDLTALALQAPLPASNTIAIGQRITLRTEIQAMPVLESLESDGAAIAVMHESLVAQNDRFTKLQAFKEETTALIVHDLKGPLSAITTNLEVALEQLDHLNNEIEDDVGNERLLRVSDIRGALQDSRQSGARLFRMIANLLDVARSDEGRLVPRPIDSDVGSFLRRMTRERGAEARLRDISLSCEISVNDSVRMDEDLIGRVLENLLDNALRYTRRGGRIMVSARRIADGSSADGDLELIVANDGVPVDRELRARIFEKYEQGTGSGGATYTRGLGLYFCRLATRAHGGEITLGDEPGFPTAFKLRLPMQ